MAVRPPDATVRTMARPGVGVASQPAFTVGLGAYAVEALSGEREETRNPTASLHERGLLEPGKVADLVVLGEDIPSVPPERIRHIPVEMTVIGGRVVHRRGEDPTRP